MTKWRSRARQFVTDESGIFAVVFGIMAVVLVAFSGAVVDFVGVQNAKGSAQVVLDSAILAVHSETGSKTETEIGDLVEDILNERLNNLNLAIDVENVTVDPNTGSLFIQAQFGVPTAFLSLVGIPQLSVRVHSQASNKSKYLEVAMVLDNSGSMNTNSRMANLKVAATNATNILFNGAASSTTVQIGVVPFTDFVNVGSSNASASWIDVAGNSSIANDNFDDDDNDATPFNGPVNRLALYNQLSNVSWGGCVNARPHTQTSSSTAHLDTDDTPPNPLDPDTYFVPSFVPDMPDSFPIWQGNYLNDSAAGSCPPLSGTASEREHQARLCKYNGAILNYGWGPNYNCPTASTLPLSGTKQVVLNAINAMNAAGSTNIHMGAVWGHRLLSPSEPFTEGRPYNQETTKVLILMTDGENTMYSAPNLNGAYYYSAYGYPYNGRLGAMGWDNTQLRNEMDARTIEACDNAKAKGIVVYTIGLSPPNSATQAMLQNCASEPDNAYFPTDPNQLNAVFAQIATHLTALRLAQ